MNEARLQELRAEHRPATRGPEKGYCLGCGKAYPCEDSQILDLALEAERLRAALKQARDDVWRIVDSALAGTEAKNG